MSQDTPVISAKACAEIVTNDGETTMKRALVLTVLCAFSLVAVMAQDTPKVIEVNSLRTICLYCGVKVVAAIRLCL